MSRGDWIFVAVVVLVVGGLVWLGITTETRKGEQIASCLEQGMVDVKYAGHLRCVDPDDLVVP